MKTNILDIKNNTQKITYSGILIGLSLIGSLIKIQGSIAFDSMPGYFAALFLGPFYGGIVLGLGHLLTALTSGFLLTLPMHIIVASGMAIIGFVFGWIYRRINGIVSVIAAVLLNGPVLAIIVVPVSKILGLPLNGWPLFYAVIIPLTIASLTNVLLGYVLYKFITNNI